MDCGGATYNVVTFPAEATIDCNLKAEGTPVSITWYYNHGRCDPPPNGGVCASGADGSTPTELAQWADGTVIKGFGAYTEVPMTFVHSSLLDAPVERAPVHLMGSEHVTSVEHPLTPEADGGSPSGGARGGPGDKPPSATG